MRLGISHLYSKNSSVFLDFVHRTDQKDTIAQEVIKHIPPATIRRSLAITDIGAGH